MAFDPSSLAQERTGVLVSVFKVMSGFAATRLHLAMTKLSRPSGSSSDAAQLTTRSPNPGSGLCGEQVKILLLPLLLLPFALLQRLIPPRAGIQFGADEGFELAKATFWLNGCSLYTEGWNDQPPPHRFLVVQVLTHLVSATLGTRPFAAVAAVLALAVLVGSFSPWPAFDAPCSGRTGSTAFRQDGSQATTGQVCVAYATETCPVPREACPEFWGLNGHLASPRQGGRQLAAAPRFA